MTKRTLRLGALAIMLAATGTAGWSASANATASGIPAGEFAAAFAPINAAPLPAAKPVPGAVDILAHEPPTDEAAEEARADTGELVGSGLASFYGAKFHGRRTASGERFDKNAMTAAHRTLPFGTRLRVTNERNGRSVVVTINDRGPFHGKRILDLSRAAAEDLGLIRAGSAPVRLERVG